jgi:hypothetical protein
MPKILPNLCPGHFFKVWVVVFLELYKIGVINQSVIAIPITDIWLKIIHKKFNRKKGEILLIFAEIVEN